MIKSANFKYQFLELYSIIFHDIWAYQFLCHYLSFCFWSYTSLIKVVFDFYQNSYLFQNLSKNVQSFIRTFTLNKVYRHTIPYFSHKLWVILFPEMYSNRNLNAWNIFKYYVLHLKTTDMLHTCFWAFSPATVLL